MSNQRNILTSIDGVLCFKENGTDYALGYLYNLDGGTFCPSTGRWTGISFEEKDAHNKALAEAELKGLDENCKIGQQGTFYYIEKDKSVQTWGGIVVSTDISLKGISSITFKRNGKTFRGRLQKDADCFNFTRIS